MSRGPKLPPKAVLLVSIAAVSTASILIRMSSAHPLAIAAYRMIISTLILAPFLILSGEPHGLRDLDRNVLLKLIGAGFFLALHFATWISSLSLTSVTSSVIFVHLDPVFVAFISHFILGERITRRMLLGIITAVSGASLIALEDIGLGEGNLQGDLLSLIGALMLGLYILSGRRLRQSLDLLTYVVPVYGTAATILTAGCLIAGVPFTYQSREYILFTAIALVPMIFGHTLYNWALRYLKASIVSTSLLGEPVGASILAFLLLGEKPTPVMLLGALITLIGIYICIRSS
ncbi:MAG: DMT family transporter [Candidatus Bathyarchaeia archaeon]|nr:DMT family transporter [Candidatus Bathyarchaeota archaeon]